MITETNFSVRKLAAYSLAALAITLAACVPAAAGAGPFTPPTPEELAMKEVPGFPGAPACVLFREQITKDDLHVVQHYDRIKILSEEGKKYANVELRYFSISDSGSSDGFGDDKTMGDVMGRTIHADGTIIPFIGKPYKKTMEKTKGVKYEALVFTLPDVEIGSIIEYRYSTRIRDNIFEAPSWFIQGDLYLKSAHFQWFPTTHELQDKHGAINTISWFPVLPAGVEIEKSEIPTGGRVYEVHVKDVPPQVHEDHMPPITSWSYRVLFNFSSYRSGAEYWKSEGNDWSKRMDSFANPNGDLRRYTETVTAGAATPDEKLHKIYAAIMKFENTGYTREREQSEEKAAGTARLNTVADVFKRERGTPTQLTALFVGMARAAGLKAYLMYVPDRSEELFTPRWMSFEQFDAVVAIVNLDGKEVFFDPGSRFCSYGHLAWEHTMIGGLRQVDGGTAFAETPAEAYKENKTLRTADLTMDAQGEVKGKVDITFAGSPALVWRHRALRGDAESLKLALKEHLQNQLPKSVEVEVVSVSDVTDYEKPLHVTYDLTGHLGSATGKRMLLPAALFESSSNATFPHEKRELPVYFSYPQLHQDAARITLSPGFEIEAVPDAAHYDIPQREIYSLAVEKTANSVTVRRNLYSNDVIVKKDEYGELRKFYSQFEGKDHESVIVRLQPQTAPVSGGSN